MNARHQYHYSISFALLIAAGLWGLFWIPQRALESGGLTGGWATISQMIIPFSILLRGAFRRTSGKEMLSEKKWYTWQDTYNSVV